MLIMLFGITGAGKSYLTNAIIENLPFNKVVGITTREKRAGEIEGIDKYFVTERELQQKINNGDIIYNFKYLGINYAYYKKDMITDNNIILEMHYTELEKLKKIFPQMISIYIIPKSIEEARKALKRRELKSSVEQERLDEMINEYKLFGNNNELLRKFDSVLYNNYDDASKKELIKLVESYLETKEEYSI